MAVDSYTIALLHFNGDNNSTTIVDEAGNSWTVVDKCKLTTTNPKFGTACLTSGAASSGSSHIYTADNDKWRLDDGDNSKQWTIDLWVNWSTDPGTGRKNIIGQNVNTSNGWVFYLNNNQLCFTQVVGGTNTINIVNNWNPAANTWYHIALVKDGTNGYMMFVDGTQIGSTQTDTTPLENFATSLVVSKWGTSYMYSTDKFDELRISKGIARWTANFTPPTAEYKSGFKPKIIMM